MAIAGLGTYSSTSFYYASTGRSKSSKSADEAAFGLLANGNENKNSNDVAVTKPTQAVPYSRCITANIRTEEMFASQSADGEMIYSYKASEQSFKIWVNSDGENKSYSIEGIDKDGQAFTKEFDPHNVDPEYADFPEFSALCMYLQNTEETADLLANEYFASDDILEKKNYMEMLGNFGNDDMFAGMQSMIDYANKMFNEMQNFINKLSGDYFSNDPYCMDLLTMDMDEISADDNGISHFAPNAPDEVKKAMAEAMEETGYEMEGKMNFISQMLVKQVENSHNGIDNPNDIFGSTVESALSAAKELLERIENPLTPISQRGEGVEKYIEQEKEFFKALIGKLENIQAGSVTKPEEIQEAIKPEYIEKSIGLTTFDGKGYVAVYYENSPANDPIVKVDGKEYHINDIDPSHATQIEMFAYLSYMDHKGLSGNHGMSSYSKMKAYASQAEYNGAASGIYDGKTAFDVKMNWQKIIENARDTFMSIPQTRNQARECDRIIELFMRKFDKGSHENKKNKVTA